MDIRKYITKKNVIIGAVAGTAIIGGIVALVVKHAKKKKADEMKSLFDDDDYEIDEYADEYWDEDIDDDDCVADEIPAQLAERVAQYNEAAERLLEELENGTYGK